MRSSLLLLAGVLAASSQCAFSSVIGVSPATYNGVLFSNGPAGQAFILPKTPGDYTLREESLSMTGTPQAAIEGTASSTAPGGGVGGTASHGGGYISYFFMYAGPGSISIPVVLDTVLDISLSGTKFYTGNAYASIKLTSNYTGDLANVSIDCNLYTDCTKATYKTPIHANIMSNTEYEIRLDTGWQVENGNSAHVLADPTISIDPSFTGDPSQLVLFQSDGIGNGSSVPEPGTEGLMGIAAGGLFVVRRRRKGRKCINV